MQSGLSICIGYVRYLLCGWRRSHDCGRLDPEYELVVPISRPLTATKTEDVAVEKKYRCDGRTIFCNVRLLVDEGEDIHREDFEHELTMGREV